MELSFTSLVIFLVVCVNVFYAAEAVNAVTNKTAILTEADIKSGFEFWKKGITATVDVFKKVQTSIKKSIEVLNKHKKKQNTVM